MITTLPKGFGIVVIDMQNNFFPGITKEKKDAMVAAQLEVLDSAATNDYPVVLIDYQGHGPSLPEIVEAVKRVPRSDFLTKPLSSGFEETNLDRLLALLDVDCMGLMGISARTCVMATAIKSPENISYLTVETLIADPIMAESRGQHFPTRNHLYLDTIDWYQRNGLACFESHKDLIALMGRK